MLLKSCKILKKYREKYITNLEKSSLIFLEEDTELEEMDLDKLLKALNNLLLKNKEIQTSININEIQREEYTLDKCVEKK